MDRNIKPVSIKTKITKAEINYKGGAVADDVGVLCGSDPGSIQGVFSQYGRLTRRSGLELNTEKTKILNLHSD